MIITPTELIELLATVSKAEPLNKDLTRALNRMIVQARLCASNPALKRRARAEMEGLQHAAEELEKALRGR